MSASRKKPDRKESKMKENLYKTLDMDKYPRKAHFDYFRKLAYPYVGVTMDVDVTELARASKHDGFYVMFMHAAALAADGIPEFRQRIQGAGIVEFKECPTSHTEMKADGSYCYCTLHHHMPLAEYLDQAKKQRALCQADGTIEEDEDSLGMYFISTLPWLHYTSLIQPVAGGDESNPRITWGKYQVQADGRYIMPVTVLAHHSLVDGIHLGLFYQKLDCYIQTLAMELWELYYGLNDKSHEL